MFMLFSAFVSLRLKRFASNFPKRQLKFKRKTCGSLQRSASWIKKADSVCELYLLVLKISFTFKETEAFRSLRNSKRIAASTP